MKKKVVRGGGGNLHISASVVYRIENHNYSAPKFLIFYMVRPERKLYVEVLATRNISASALNLIRNPQLHCAKCCDGIQDEIREEVVRGGVGNPQHLRKWRESH